MYLLFNDGLWNFKLGDVFLTLSFPCLFPRKLLPDASPQVTPLEAPMLLTQAQACPSAQSQPRWIYAIEQNQKTCGNGEVM